MTIGGSLLLVAAGAILKWAVTGTVSWINIQTVGTILFIIGLAGLVLALVYTFYRSDRDDDVATRPMRPPGPR